MSRLIRNRRLILRAAFAAAVGLPLARIGWMRWRDAPLPVVAKPDIRIVSGWALDVSDLARAETK
jgi:autonomous glycyl radical cofactor GrcA